MMIDDDLNALFTLAKNTGVRFDLIQAGGGNISLKADDGILYVKASGINLSEMKSIENCAQINLNQLKLTIETIDLTKIHNKKQFELFGKKALDEANITNVIKPSIETFFHVYGYKFTVHTHPVWVNAIMITKDAKNTIKNLFPQALYIDYYTPGVELAVAISNEIKIYQSKYGGYPHIIFLKNHGVIVSGNNLLDVTAYYDKLMVTLTNYLGLDFQKYTNVTKIMNIYNKINNSDKVAYLSTDHEITNILNNKIDLFKINATYPDQYVFNGIISCFSNTLDDLENNLLNYSKKYCEVAKVVILEKDSTIYFMADNLKRASEMEDVFKFHLLSLKYAVGEIDSLSVEEFKYLSSWDAEKYRQKL